MTDPSAVEEVRVGAPAEAIWSILHDPDALRRILPGCESATSVGADRYRLVLATKVAFFTVRADVDATYLDADEPRHLRLELDGRPRGLDGSFRASIPFDLDPIEGGRATLVRYSLTVETTGSMGMLGPGAIRGAVGSQVGELVRDLEREAAGRG